MIFFIEVTLPIRIRSEMNEGDHIMARRRRFKEHKKAAHYLLLPHRQALREMAASGLQIVVTLTRIGVGTLDGDNNQSGLKAVRDSVAASIGIDDGSPRYDWRYGQEKSKEYGARVRVEVMG